MDQIPLIIYDLSIVDEFIRTFHERDEKKDLVNDLIYSSFVPAIDNRHLLYTTDSVALFAYQKYNGRSFELDTLFGSTKRESTFPMNDTTDSVFTLLATKSLEVRPVYFITMDSFHARKYDERVVKKYKLITVEEALEIIKSAKKTMNSQFNANYE